MFAKNFEKWDSILGWGVFFIALIVYGLTVEPTGSWWDAGEYITTSAKLQVAHPTRSSTTANVRCIFCHVCAGGGPGCQNGQLYVRSI